MRTQVVMIDLENVQPDLLPALKAEHVQVRVFIGPLQAKLPTDLVLGMQALGDRAKFIRVAKQGKESLDLHLAYHMGQLSCQFDGAYFHVVSKDKGFDALVEHLNVGGVPCAKLVESLAHIHAAPLLVLPAEIPAALNERAQLVVAWLKARQVSRPAKRATLLSSLEKSLFSRQLPVNDVERVLSALVRDGWISFEGEKVKYSEGLNV